MSFFKAFCHWSAIIFIAYPVLAALLHLPLAVNMLCGVIIGFVWMTWRLSKA